MHKYYLSQERFDELKKELENLKSSKRREIAERLKTAKEFGDLSENAEYSEAREEQAKVEGRIFELEEIMKQVAVIEKTGVVDQVGVGSMVTVKKDDKVIQYSIVGSNETSPEAGKISNESPMGRALLGRKVGDKITVKTPGGETNFVITKIE
ncbi:MAG: transcription elongation factor GreA [Candidatus Liptonbacteria bacterium]|nr:transcription elongation factor GreA [Candidatus Liptonbacteria bacterium]